jgi:MHS family proline/betaine transporter-like MFS transporter
LLSQRLERRQVYAGAVGNVLEWYDFAVYGFLAPIIGKVFFPSGDPVTSLLAAYGALAAGYFSRPLGSVLFGHLGDRIGRKPALILSMVLMGAATLGIAVLPGHAAIGAAAPALLLVLRCLQGIAVAGEYGTSAVLLVEQAPIDRRGLVAGWVMAACNLGFLLGSGVGALVSAVLGDAAMAAWGWRVPFFLGALIAVHVLVMRRSLAESAQPPERKSALPVVEALRHHYRAIGMIVCLVLPIAVTFYMCFVYASSYLVGQMHFSTAQALDITTLALALQVVVAPWAGHLADRYGRRPMMLLVTIAGLVTTWPLWWAMHQQSVALVVLAQMSFALINGIGWSLTIPIMVELVPARVRVSASGIAFNLCLGLFGGTAPWVATYLVARTADDFAPAWYMMAAALLALLATLRMPEMAGRPLER